MTIQGFDPLGENLRDGAPERGVLEAATKRVVTNILKSYTGYYDPFSEMLQNALDALDERKKIDKNFKPKLWIAVNLRENRITVVDNGVGMDLDQFRYCFRPNVSFKGRSDQRGHKGVGATFLAYGFSLVKLQTKKIDFQLAGILRQGREWADDEGYTVSRPRFEEIELDSPELASENSGTAIEILIKAGQRPQLGWLQATKASQWLDVLRVKTPLGGVYLSAKERKLDLECNLEVIQFDGARDRAAIRNPEYYYPHEIPILHKVQDIASIDSKLNSIQGDTEHKYQRLPDEFRRLDAVYQLWSKDELLADSTLMRNLGDEESRTLIERHQISVYGCFVSTAKTWTEFKERLAVRRNADVLRGGLQLASDFMVQGDPLVIPLTSTIGYQANTHVIVHLIDGNPDMGRKVFQPEIKSLAEEVSRRVVDVFKRYLRFMREDTGAPLPGESDDLWHWQQEQIKYRNTQPFQFEAKSGSVSLVSVPRSEQDVIALFHELLALRIVDGYGVYGTSESSKYDSLFFTRYEKETHLYHSNNPLGVGDAASFGRESKPYVLEYKYSFDALVADLEREKKYEGDINLVVVWELGSSFKERYIFRSYLVGDEGSTRAFFGSTHVAFRGGVKAFEVICLADLVSFLREPETVIARHKAA